MDKNRKIDKNRKGDWQKQKERLTKQKDRWTKTERQIDNYIKTNGQKKTDRWK